MRRAIEFGSERDLWLRSAFTDTGGVVDPVSLDFTALGGWERGAFYGLVELGIVFPDRASPATSGEVPNRTIPARTIPSRTIPSRTIPAHTIPARTIPAHTVVTADAIPAHTIAGTPAIIMSGNAAIRTATSGTPDTTLDQLVPAVSVPGTRAVPAVVEPAFVVPAVVEPSYVEPSYVEPSYVEPGITIHGTRDEAGNRSAFVVITTGTSEDTDRGAMLFTRERPTLQLQWTLSKSWANVGRITFTPSTWTLRNAPADPPIAWARVRLLDRGQFCG